MSEHSAQKGAAREAGSCGEAHPPEDYEWDPLTWVGGAPVMVCRQHGAPAPGWAYDPTTRPTPPGASP